MMPIRADPDPQNGAQTCSVYADPLGPDPTGLGVADIRQQNIETQAPTGPIHSYNLKLIHFPVLRIRILIFTHPGSRISDSGSKKVAKPYFLLFCDFFLTFYL
jgi:hypothetical protein